MSWLSEIENRLKAYGSIEGNLAVLEKERMARVIRELANIAQLGSLYQEGDWYDDGEENFLIAIENLSNDAKELLQ